MTQIAKTRFDYRDLKIAEPSSETNAYTRLIAPVICLILGFALGYMSHNLEFIPNGKTLIMAEKEHVAAAAVKKDQPTKSIKSTKA
ncbi:MAG: hypothetical protein ACHQJ6_09090 [Candidatus Berkiellales bacterium]